jgi:hypothetical protein
MKTFELKSLLETLNTDITYYNSEMLKYDHYMLKQVEYGVQVSASDLESRERILKVVKTLKELQNQIKESIKGQENV